MGIHFYDMVSQFSTVYFVSSQIEGYFFLHSAVFVKIPFCLFLLLYVPCQQLWSLRDGQFTYPHFFLGRLEQAVNQ